MTAGRRLVRPPGPELRPYVETLWAVEAAGCAAAEREHVLPTGQMHLVFRLGAGSLRLFGSETDVAGRAAPDALIGGARAAYYIREASGGQCSVGVQLRPGATEAFFGGAPAEAFTGRHTPLEEVWGRQVETIRDRLSSGKSLEERIAMLEAVLAARLRRVRGLHPAVARALQHFTVTTDVGRVVRESGYSHRTMVSEFHRSVGLTPKEYTRVLRLQRVIKRMTQAGTLADLAAEAGYSDQAHLCREFRVFSGVSPGEYRRLSPGFPHHLKIA